MRVLGSRSSGQPCAAAKAQRRGGAWQLFSTAAGRYTPSIGTRGTVRRDLLAATAPVPLAARMRRFAFGVIATTVLGLEADRRDVLFADFEIWTRALFSIPMVIPGTPFAKAMAARQRLLEQLTDVLQSQQPRSGGLDLLSGGLDEAGIPLDDEDLAEQLLLLLFAGYETTASSLSCLFRALLLNPDVETWLLEELQSSPWPFEPNHRSPRLDATVLEVMRQTPPVGGFFRRNRQAVQLGDVEVPEDRVIQVVLGGSSNADDDDLSQFRPQRHLDGSFHQTLLPFEVGSVSIRSGKALAELEIRLMAVGLLQTIQFNLEPDQDLSLQLIPSPTPRDGLLVSATTR